MSSKKEGGMFIEAKELALHPNSYNKNRTIRSSRNILTRKLVKVIYSEIFFLDQELINYRAEYEVAKLNIETLQEHYKDVLNSIEANKKIKRPTLECEERIKAAELRKKDLEVKINAHRHTLQLWMKDILNT